MGTTRQRSAHRRAALAEYGPGVALLPIAAYFALVPYGSEGLLGVPWLLAHSLDLLVHEAGHVIFAPLGDWLQTAGGSILQVALPALLVWQGVWTGHRLGTQAALLWLGQSFVDVSVYAADAPTRSLPLLGGLGAENHDWWWLLITTGTLEHAAWIAGVLFALGCAAWGVMVSLPRWML